MKDNANLLSKFYQLSALGSMIASAAENAVPIDTNSKAADKLMSLVYLLEDLSEEVRQLAEAELDFPDNRIARIQRENEELRKAIVALQLQRQ